MKANPLRHLFDWAKHIPWWIGVVLAGLSFAICRTLVLADFPATTDRTVSLMTGFIRGLALVGQYVLPIAFLAGAGVSAVSRYLSRKR